LLKLENKKPESYDVGHEVVMSLVRDAGGLPLPDFSSSRRHMIHFQTTQMAIVKCK